MLTLVHSPVALAKVTAFSEIYNAINQASKSLLMLEVYNENGEMFKSGSGFVNPGTVL